LQFVHNVVIFLTFLLRRNQSNKNIRDTLYNESYRAVCNGSAIPVIRAIKSVVTISPVSFFNIINSVCNSRIRRKRF